MKNDHWLFLTHRAHRLRSSSENNFHDLYVGAGGKTPGLSAKQYKVEALRNDLVRCRDSEFSYKITPEISFYEKQEENLREFTSYEEYISEHQVESGGDSKIIGLKFIFKKTLSTTEQEPLRETVTL